jgi:hypothetical protein
MLKGSSQYWKGTFSDLGKNFCQCNRVEIGDEHFNEEEDTQKVKTKDSDKQSKNNLF